MNILIIGGTRFMGPHLVRRLTGDGHAVTVFHRGETTADLPDTTAEIFGDRDRLSDYANELAAVNPEVVVDMMLRDETQAQQVVDMCTSKVRRLVMASSCDVYRKFGLLIGSEEGEPSAGPLTESSPLRRDRYPYRRHCKDESDKLYQYDKIPIEEMMMAADFESVILRLPMIYGPHDYQHRLYEYLKRMDDGRPAIILESEAEQMVFPRGFVEDCAHALYLATVRDEAANNLFNVADNRMMTERSWIEAIAKEVKWDGRIHVASKESLPEELRSSLHYGPDISVDSTFIRQKLGFIETVSFEESLRRTIDWERDNPPPTPHALHYELEDGLI